MQKQFDNQILHGLSEERINLFSRGQTGYLGDTKVFVKSSNGSQDSIDHILNEVRCLSKVGNIENVLLPLVCMEGPKLVFPFLEKSLADQIGLMNPIDVQERVIRPLLKTLVDLHSKGIIHSDLKAENVRMQDNGTIYLTDFGSARPISEHNPQQLGCLPQHRTPDWTINPLVDIYALGVLAYQLIFGVEFLRDFQLKGRNFDSVPEAKGVPRHLLSFIMRATDCQVDQRFHSARQALDCLAQTSGQQEVEIEEYKPELYFEVYLEFMKQTFIASDRPLSEFSNQMGCSAEKYHKRIIDGLLDEKKSFLHLRINGELIGICEASVNSGGVGFISTLFIRKPFRRKGFARKLEDSALAFFRRQGCSWVELNVAERNLDALEFYKRSGYAEADRRMYEGAILLRKPI